MNKYGPITEKKSNTITVHKQRSNKSVQGTNRLAKNTMPKNDRLL